MKTQRDVASFVLRMTHDLWRDPNGDPKVQWRGHIQHVQSRSEASFADFADAVAFIQQHTAQVTLDSVAEDDPTQQDKAMRESQNLWQRFAGSYAHMVLGTFEQTARQSDKGMQWWLNAWRMPFAGAPGNEPNAGAASDAQTALLHAVRELSAQVERLSERVAELEEARPAPQASRPSKRGASRTDAAATTDQTIKRSRSQ